MAGALAAAAGAAQAATDPAKIEARYTPAYQACLDAADGSSSGMIGCITDEFKVQDARLNTAYHKVMAGLNERQKAKLRAAQRAWVVFRDADCQSASDEDWGTVSYVGSNSCMLVRTVERTLELEAFPFGGEADSTD